MHDLIGGNGGQPSIPSDFLLEVSKGNIPGHSPVSFFAHNLDVDTNQTTIWQVQGESVIQRSVAVTLTLSSTSNNDTAVGTGARSIEITGLLANFTRITETVVLNGQTPVNTVNQYIAVNALLVVSAGVALSNLGDIYIGSGTVSNGGVPAVIDNLIYFNSNNGVGDGGSQVGFATIPAGFSFYLQGMIASVDSGKSIEVAFYKRVESGLIYSLGGFDIVAQVVNVSTQSNLVFREKQVFDIRSRVVNGNAAIKLFVKGVLIDNAYVTDLTSNEFSVGIFQ